MTALEPPELILLRGYLVKTLSLNQAGQRHSAKLVQ